MKNAVQRQLVNLREWATKNIKNNLHITELRKKALFLSKWGWIGIHLNEHIYRRFQSTMQNMHSSPLHIKFPKIAADIPFRISQSTSTTIPLKIWNNVKSLRRALGEKDIWRLNRITRSDKSPNIKRTQFFYQTRTSKLVRI